MARCPFAAWEPRGTPGGAIAPRTVIVHSEATAGGLAKPTGGPLEWHFMVRRDGRILQHVDTQRRADANNKANAFAVSIETEDDGYPDREAWTDAQLWALERLIRWIATAHQIPLRRCPSWQTGGVGYHTMFGAPSPWTPVVKTCPGKVRIRQFDEVLLPRLVGSASTEQPPTEEPDVIGRDQLDDRKAAARQLFRLYLGRNPGTQDELDKAVRHIATKGYEATVVRFADHGGDLAA